MKVCKKCGENKPLSEYHKKKQSKDGHESACKVCRNAERKAYYEANREKVTAQQKAYYEANREEILVANKAYHAEKYANDPEYRAQRNAAAIRRKRLLASAVQEPYLREDIFERDNWTCGLCDEPIDPELRFPDSDSASIDHIIPISHGGDDTPDNVQAAHLSCNLSKGNRVELEDQAMLAGIAG